MPSFFMPRVPFQHNYYTPIPRQITLSKNPPLRESVVQNSSNEGDRLFPQQNSQDRKQKDSPFLEIFGLELFFDDILLLSLIFFLYSEGVKDEMLFIVLIMLLLS